MIDRIFKFFCSLRLTVVLLGAGLVLVFVGTLAQVHEGLFAAQVRYFKSWYIWQPTIGDSTWPIILPGGYLIGTLLLINLISAHIKRFQFTTKKLGIHLIHGGLILLLLGQLLTDLLSRESSMRLFEGMSSNYSEDFRANELVMIDSSDPKSDQVVSIPESLLARKGDLRDAALPVTVRVKNYWVNCDVEEIPPPEAVAAIADHGIYTNMSVLPLPDSAPDGDQTRAAVLVEIASPKGSNATFLVPAKAEEQQTFESGGQAYSLSFLFAPMMGGNLLAISRVGDMGGASMVTFPEADLARKGELHNEALPFTLHVKGYWAKCQLFHRPGPNSVLPHANQGMLAGAFVTPGAPVTDSDHRNLPGAVVELLNNQGSLGTWLLWAAPGNDPETVVAGSKSYQMAFQFKRYYEPYSIALLKFSHDKYKGTDLPKNFSSRIRLVNPKGNEDREVLIKMNNPLRYAGITYYQASFDERMPNKPATVLEVVKNPSWLTPYLACVLVGLGLIIQFMSHLIGFAMKKENRMKLIYKVMPWFFLALFASEVIAILAPKSDGIYHVRDFGRLPVLLNGRVQPFDSVARNSLLQMRSTADLPLEEIPAWQFWHHPQKLKSTAWLLEVMTQPEQADERPIFLIHHPDLLGELKLSDKGVEKSGLRYYTFNQLKSLLPEIGSQAAKAEGVDDQLRTPLQRQVLKLANAVGLYQKLKFTLNPPGREDFAGDLPLIEEAIGPGVAAARAKEAGKTYDKAALDKITGVFSEFQQLKDEPGAGQLYPLVIPPLHPELARDDWGNLGMGVTESIRDQEIFPPLGWLATAASAYHDGNPAAFNQAVDDYTQWLAKNLPTELAKGRHEFFYNDLKAFLHAMIIYIFAFILTAGSLLTFGVVPALSESLRRSAFYLILLAGVVHTSGLIFRMVLEGRPPVTNLYSSAIFIGWGAMVLGLVLERVYRIGIGNAVASVAGFVTLLIAHNLAIGSDTMEMLRAVLDTNFWLATHVVIVTLGYASTFVAGLLAIGYITLGLFTPILSRKVVAANAPVADAGKSKKVSSPANQPDIGKALAKMVYGIVCFATLFSFVGTVLGGIWADQSWGRFWGWDPKENGALLIVIWNATILHARWGGMVRERGLMNMAIFGNIVTSFSWFGVNMLGIGLHSYGFMDAAFHWLIAFIGSQVLLILLGMLPRSMWRSFREPIAPASGPTIQGGGKPASATA